MTNKQIIIIPYNICKKTKHVENDTEAQGYKMPGRHRLSRKEEPAPGRENDIYIHSRM